MAEAQTEKKQKKLRAVIVLLVVLTALNAALLIGRIVYLNFFKETETAVVHGNVIGEPEPPESKDSTDSSSEESGTEVERAPIVELYRGRPSDNEPFKVSDMLPGDSLTKYFAVRVSHDATVTLFFDTEVTEQTRSLADVLNIKVENSDSGKVLYDGSFSGMASSGSTLGFGENIVVPKSGHSTVYYKITVSLPTSVGNEYQAAALSADFIWSVKEAEALTPPETGDSGLEYIFLAVMLASLTACFVLAALGKGRKEEKQNVG